jgi:hypothetical protein
MRCSCLQGCKAAVHCFESRVNSQSSFGPRRHELAIVDYRNRNIHLDSALQDVVETLCCHYELASVRRPSIFSFTTTEIKMTQKFSSIV